MISPGPGSDLAAAKRRYSQDVGKGTRPASSSRTRVVSQGTAEAGTTKNYILGDCLGKGASGSVYRALNWATGETVAVKRISLANIPRSELSSIMSEIDLLKGLRHPNIVKYKGFEKTKEFLFIVLEYCENGSLQSICKRFGKFPEGLVSVYINQVLEGLQFLHEQGVVHRDIKGANILTNKDGSVKLADFGVATKSGVISGNVVAGSPYWMAPEVIDQCGATSASDIWSVGCVVIELLEGHPPYHHLDPMPALFRIVQDDCPPLPEGASPMVLDFLKHCFEKDPSLRISAETLLEHPWMCSARRQMKHMKSTGSVGKDVHDHAVRTVRDHNRSSGRKERSKPPPLRLDQAQLARSDLLSPGLSSSRSLRRVAGSIASGPSTPSSPVRRSPLRLEQRADSLDCDLEPMALRGASVDIVRREPVGTATPGVSGTIRPSSVKGGRTRSSRQSTLHARDRDSAALSTGQQTETYSHQGSTSTLSSHRAGSQASTSSSTCKSVTTMPHTTTAKTSSRIAPHVLDVVGDFKSNASPLSSPREGAAAQGKDMVDTRPPGDRCEVGSSDSAWRSPSPQRIVFRSPFAIAGADLPVQTHSRTSREYVMPKDLSKVRRSVSLLKYKDAAGRKTLQASDRINQLSEESTKTSVRAQRAAAAQEQQAVESAKPAYPADEVRDAPPSSTRLASETIPTIPEQRISRQSRYASGVKRSASLLSRTFSGSSSPTRSSPRSDSATMPRTDVASDESIAATLNSSASRDVLIRVLKGWR